MKNPFIYRKGRRFRKPRTRLFSYRLTPWLLVLLLAVGSGWNFWDFGDRKEMKVMVASVYDGDTIRVRFSPTDKKTHRVRIQDIDCFELPSKYSSKQVARQMERFYLTKEEVYERGQKAKELLVSLIEAQGGWVTLEISKRRPKDVYGRILARVKAGGQNVSKALIQSSYCFVYQRPRR